MQNYDPNWSRQYFETPEKAFDKFLSYDAEWPAGFQLAAARYLIAEFDNIREIWERLDNWRRYQEGSPDAKAELAIDFHLRVLQAVQDGDRPYLKKLLKAIEAPGVPPQAEVSAIRAAIEAFLHLFVRSGFRSKDQWPTKQELRRLVEKILRDSGHTLPVERHWPRIFRKAGLTELLSVVYGPVRKTKK